MLRVKMRKHSRTQAYLIRISNGLESFILFVAQRACQAVALRVSFMHCIRQGIYSRISYARFQLFSRVSIEARIGCTISAGKVNTTTRLSTTRLLTRSALAKMR